MSRRVLICVAIQMEAKAIAQALGLTFHDRLRASGTVKPDWEVELRVVGIGARQLPVDIDAGNLDLVISAGLAGALDPSLRHGDVVVDRIYCSGEAVTTPSEKASLFQETGARAVDMETGKLLDWAKSVNVRGVAIRAISDVADEAIDPAVMGTVDPFGRMRVGSVMGTLLRRPGLIPGLMRLQKQSKVALKNLGAFLAEYLAKEKSLMRTDC
jgi:nucleoside phosphorylase